MNRAFIFLTATALIPLTVLSVNAEESLSRLVSNLAGGELTSEGEDVIQENAIIKLSLMGKPAVPAITKALLNQSEYARCAAARTLERMGPTAEDALPALIKGISPSNYSKNECFIGAIISVAADNPVALADLFKHPEADVRRMVAGNANKFGQRAAPLVPRLIEALHDSNSIVKSNSANTLGLLGFKTEPVISALTNALNDEEPGMRSSAAEALGRLGPEASKAVPALLEIFNSNQAMWVRTAAAKALVRIDPAIASKSAALSQFLDDRREADIVMAIRAGNAEELPRLQALLSDKRELVRNAAASKLAQFRQAARPAEKKLEELAKDDPSSIVRESAAGALRSLRSREGN